MNRPLLRLDRESLLQLERSMTREWLETDGIGGYASSTVLMCPTRRYHGLLVAPPPGNTKRHVFLSRFEETFVGGGKSVAISMARYRGLWSPIGHQSVERFELAPNPSFLYLFGNARLERELLMVKGQHAVIVRYRVTGQRDPVLLQIKPLLPFREADALTIENFELDKRVERLPGGIVCQPYPSLPAIAITVAGDASFEADPVWYRGLEYTTDIARGYDGYEDQFSPGFFEIQLDDGVDVFVAAALDAPIADPAHVWEQEIEARRAIASARSDGVRGSLEVGADDFLYRDPSHRLGVIAGFPWFGEWGRDTFIALPGLTLARGKIDECGEALAGAARFLDRGLMPNIFGADRASSRYNSVDASLWFARAVRLYEQAGVNVREIVERFLPALTQIATCYRDGTSLGIRCDASGLIAAGDPSLNATWMDARIGEVPVTPRDGYAVEIQALWYSLIAYMEHLQRAIGASKPAREWGELKTRAGKAFLTRFWLADAARLADVWKPNGGTGVVDRSVRPNMVIAAALEWSPLSRERRADIVACARAELVTPFGLRTLGPKEPAYVGRYDGGQDERDRAYHQGTVWPWLFGSYVEASLRAVDGVGGKEGYERVRAELRTLLDGFAEQLEVAGLNHVSEVFDGDPPHRPGGTIAQAWSTGELLRARRLLEDRAPLAERAQ